MANTVRKTRKAPASTQPVENAQLDATEATVKSDNKKPDKVVPKDIDLSQLITVRNGFQGRLIYVSPRTKEHFVWDVFGSEQDMELRELRNAKNSYKKFFQNNWFMFDDDDSWVIDYLGVSKFYSNAIRLDDFDAIFEKAPEEIIDTISRLSKGQKKSVAYRARQLVIDGTIDSRRSIHALEEALGVELIEKA